ncbi:MAG: PD-(D/E)XK nuclease family protein [Chromatiales bacterium]|nr:PD-(D/E)XK nuclease family protein [Chromatiales bacterium]
MLRRCTLLITGHLVRQHAALEAARESTHGLQLLTPAHLAARLASGFLTPIPTESLQSAVHAVLSDPTIDLGDMAPLRDLPGMVRAVTATLQRAWVAGIDLGARAATSTEPRLATIHRLEQAVQCRLPPAQLRPADLVERALGRLAHAPKVLGPITVQGVPDLDPVWRPLLLKLADVVPVTWQLGHSEPPAWLQATAITIEPRPRHTPAITRVSCANPRHEALEALRWARGLLASGAARPEDIAIAAPATGDWDVHLGAMAADANLPLAFVHGRPALATRDGQAAAALAEVLINGLGQGRVRRVLSLVRGMTAATEALPADWHRILPADAPLLKAEQWAAVIAEPRKWPDGHDFGPVLRELIKLLDGGIADAAAIGTRLLAGRALAIWQKALRDGPAAALDVTLTTVRVADDTDPTTNLVWCSAADAAAAPRAYVRLLGLTSRGWPRTQSEDPLLPTHIIDSADLNPVPVPERDRRDYRTLLKATSRQLVLSRSRRDAEGRQTGVSALLRESGVGEAQELYLRREAVPAHAASEADRLLARPAEFAQAPRARSARTCWQDWHKPELTAHDGLVRADHPVLLRALAGRFSASRLRRLSRDPLGFVWQYALGWKAPEEVEEPLVLDPRAFGNLTHRVLELALASLEAKVGFARTPPAGIEAAVMAAAREAGEEFELGLPVPPRLIWLRTLIDARTQALTALGWQEPPLPGQASWGEVPFGGTDDGTYPDGHWPWDIRAPVAIPGTGLTIGGVIDRLDLSGDRTRARVTDYKTGKVPKKEIQVDGGQELQRCLYASAVQVLLGGRVNVEARLLYPRDDGLLLTLADPPATLERIAHYLQAARDQVAAGRAVIGPDSGERLDNELSFALPGNAKEIYLLAKLPLASAALAPLPELWDLP